MTIFWRVLTFMSILLASQQTFSQPRLATVAWPAGARAEAYLAQRTGLRYQIGAKWRPPYQAASRLTDLLRLCGLPHSLASVKTQSRPYHAANSKWGTLHVIIYSYNRPTALDSVYQLLVQRRADCSASDDCGCAQESRDDLFRFTYFARSKQYLLLFDGNGLSYTLTDFIPYADHYAALVN